VNHFALEEVLKEDRHIILLTYSRICLFAFIAIIYLLLAVLAKTEKRQPGQTPEKREELEFIFGTSLTKALITVLIAAITTSPSTYLPPPIGITTIALITYFPINLFKKRQRR
jgi:amino acid transporter